MSRQVKIRAGLIINNLLDSKVCFLIKIKLFLSEIKICLNAKFTGMKISRPFAKTVCAPFASSVFWENIEITK